MDRTMVPDFDILVVSLHSFIISIVSIISIPISNRIVRAFTREPSGITMQQRIGTGTFISTICMIVASLVEIQRLQTAKDCNLVDSLSATVPMSIWWLGPHCSVLVKVGELSLKSKPNCYHGK